MIDSRPSAHSQSKRGVRPSWGRKCQCPLQLASKLLGALRLSRPSVPHSAARYRPLVRGSALFARGVDSRPPPSAGDLRRCSLTLSGGASGRYGWLDVQVRLTNARPSRPPLGIHWRNCRPAPWYARLSSLGFDSSVQEPTHVGPLSWRHSPMVRTRCRPGDGRAALWPLQMYAWLQPQGDGTGATPRPSPDAWPSTPCARRRA